MPSHGRKKGVDIGPTKPSERYVSDHIDYGHAAICGRCGKGHDLKFALIGRPRDLRLETCEACVISPVPKKTAKPWGRNVER